MSAALSPGTKLGRYEIRSQIGVGGMGEVYLAQDTTLDRKVALKVLPENVASNLNRMQRFVQEAKAASALNHPNIITIHEIGTEPGAHFMATEFIDGDNLRHHLRHPLPLAEAIDIAIQVASALASAHGAGIIHRDIKPENIMLRRDGIVKVLDFGLAKLTEHWRADDVNGDAATQAFVLTEPGTVVGTTAYLSPEQARALEVDTRTDIWSLGVVLYEMITRHAPFKSETASDTSAAILKTEPPPLSEFVPEVPAEIERIVRKALQKNREERYQGVKDMLLDLKTLKRDLDIGVAMQRSGAPYSQEAMTRTVISTAPAATTDHSSLQTTHLRLNKKAGLVAAATALLVLGAAGWYWWRHREVDTGRMGALTVAQLFNRKNGLVETGTSHARFSPDGKFVAYASSASSRGNNNTIWLKQVVSGEPFTNQPDLSAAASPIWSPDGLQIAFLSKRQGQNGIWAMAAFGGSPTLLKPLENFSRELVAWTRSGKIYFAMQGNLYCLNVASQEISPITKLEGPKDRDFAVSPDEQQVAYSDTTDGQSDLWVVPISGGHPARVTNDKPQDTNPAWTPDGKRIVYSSKRNGIKQICVARVDGSLTTQLWGSDTNSNVLDVSSDGTRILYSTDRDESDLWSVRLDQSRESQLTTDTGITMWPDVSPDGKVIAYQSLRAPTGATLFNSLLMSKPLSEAAAPVQLAPDGFAPLWSPDGQQVAFLHYVNGTSDLWMVHPAGGDARPVTTGGVIFGGFTQLPYNRMQTQDFHWTGDSTHLIYCAKNSNLVNVWQIGIDGSAPVRLSDNEDSNLRLFNPASAPDGRRIAWLGVSNTKTVSVWLLDHNQQKKIFDSNSAIGMVGWTAAGDELILKTVSGTDTPNAPVDITLITISIPEGKQRTLAQLPAAYFQNIKLAPARNQVAYVSREEGTDSLRIIPVTGGTPRTLVNIPDPRVYLASIVWSPDGKMIYYGKQSSWTVFSMIDNFR
jgi:serine/threonine protein kinase